MLTEKKKSIFSLITRRVICEHKGVWVFSLSFLVAGLNAATLVANSTLDIKSERAAADVNWNATKPCGVNENFKSISENVYRSKQKIEIRDHTTVSDRSGEKS